MSPRHKPVGPAHARGFSLLETLVALAILSVSALLIFQFVGQQFSLTGRVEAAVSTNLSRVLQREQFSTVVAGLVPAWPDAEEPTFTGNEAGFVGLSSGLLNAASERLGAVSLGVEPADRGDGSVLVYRSGGFQMVVAALPAVGRFSYLGPDGVWRPAWPGERPKDPGAFDDSEHYTQAQLPLAVRLQLDGEAGVDWVAIVDWQARPLYREQDIERDMGVID